MSVNDVTAGLKPYPMEELTRIRKGLIKDGTRVYDFGTGDPKIPTWGPIRKAVQESFPEISQYPSVVGLDELNDSIWVYLKNRYGMTPSKEWTVVPTSGSKEAVFTIGLCLIGRKGKKVLIYPNPGYPVYRSSALFAGGVPYPVRLDPENGYLLEPWTLPKDVQKNAAAIWINYPHNPTGAMAPKDYFERVINWCHENDVILLSDDCYVDIYHPRYDAMLPKEDLRPINPITLTSDNIISFMSLSKRSGITGYRSGAMVGSASLMGSILRARANFGVGSPDPIQKAAAVAWRDEAHVAERRKIFASRMDLASAALDKLGILATKPDATFYLWCRTPKMYGDDDVRCVLDLAKTGVIATPSQWLSEDIPGFIRFALVPEEKDIQAAMEIVTRFVKEKN